MTATVTLTTDELLTTTRAVRKRLDLVRPIERELLEECLQIAQQAPTQSNMQNWRFVVVTEPDTRAALADLFRRGLQEYLALPFAVSEPTGDAVDGCDQRTDPELVGLSRRTLARGPCPCDPVHRASTARR